MADVRPIIPDYITVHLGQPDSNAQNRNVNFIRYIKNIASAENDPTWPESALLANIYALITNTLNTIYNEDYRTRGYGFDITNPTPGGYNYVENREIFGNIGHIVDEIFNEYIIKGKSVKPYLAQYCNINDKNCNGLIFLDTVKLAEAGYTPYQILQYFYGNDIGILRNAPITVNIKPYPGIPLRLGSWGDTVTDIQNNLNTISLFYHAIPFIPASNNIFNEMTRSAVEKFQEIFDLPANGIVEKSTWYKIQFINNAVKKVEELFLKGITLADVDGLYKKEHKIGDNDDFVNVLRFYLYFLSDFDDRIPDAGVGREFTQKTREAVIAFQRTYGLPADGIVNEDTWSKIKEIYLSALSSVPEPVSRLHFQNYPGNIISTGTGKRIVEQIQTYLFLIAQYDKAIPLVDINGIYDSKTKSAVMELQKLEGIKETGYIGPLTWTAIVNRYNEYQNRQTN